MQTGAISFSSSPLTAADPRQQHLILVQSSIHADPDVRLLSADEVEKANRFVKEEDRTSFLLRRATLRKLLSRWLHIPPWEISYQLGVHGKPVLQQAPLHFNVSKTKGFNVYCFGPVVAGIDIERIDPARRFPEIEATQLHPDEKEKVNSDHDFFAVWTRKESVLKADGSGITDHLALMNTANRMVAYRDQTYQVFTVAGDTFVLSFAVAASEEVLPVFFLE